ncbi:MAG: 30S ribosome-binding factor RbfA [Oscillospiraceae bacterium]|jgi:ribosome-binding factor A|nr:30S ribosome-binding factor RbfA [Oscillospiraceae bacterium]
MASQNRIGQINGEILRVLSDRVPRCKDPRIDGLVSVVRVDTTSDLSLCRVYVSSLGGGADMAKGLKSASGYLRRELGKELQLRHTPELEFIVDRSIEEGSRILDKIRELDLRDE